MYSAWSTSGTVAHVLLATDTSSEDGTGGSPPPYLSRSIHRRKAARCGKGEIAGVPTGERAEVAKARKRIRELELQVEILQIASMFLEDDPVDPVIDRLVDTWRTPKVCCRMRGVSNPA